MKQKIIIGNRFSRVFFGVDEAYTAVLTTLGLPTDKVEALKAVTAETAKDFKPDEYVTTIKSGLETTFLNDPNFLEKITADKIPQKLKQDYESGQYGRFMNEAKDFFTKTLGLDLSDLTEAEGKSLKTVLQKAAEKHAGKLNSPEAMKTLQTEVSKLMGENNELKTGSEKAIQAALDGERGKTGDLLTKLLTQNELGGLKLKVKPGLVTHSVIAKAKELYTVKLEGTEIKIFRKDQPTLQAVNTDGTIKSFSQVVKEIAASEDILEKETEKKEEEEKGTKTIVVAGAETIEIPAHIREKMEANKKLEKSVAG